MEESVEYNESLQVKIKNNFMPLTQSARKTGLVGLIVSLLSVWECFFVVLKSKQIFF